MIHVSYRLWGGDGFFAKMCGTSMLSMFENTKEKITVHIMHNDHLTPDNRGKFCYIAGQYNQKVEFHNVEEIAGDTLRKFEAAHPISSGVNASWYPLIVHEVFPDLDKLICLGADTVINLDIGELWAYDLNNMEGAYYFGAVSELLSGVIIPTIPLVTNGYVRPENYFNADVLLVRPDFFKENFERILESCKFIFDNGYPFAEQDALNYLFSDHVLKLPRKFNAMVRELRRSQMLFVEKEIYHYADAKPDLNTNDIFNRLYFEYFLKTPWATVDMFGNLNKALEKMFGQLFNESRNLLLHMTNLLVERQRAFLVDKDSLEALKQIFDIKPDEFVMTTSEGIEKFVKALTDANGKKIFYVLIGNPWQYLQLRNFLLSRNFIEGTDFVNGTLFLSEQQGFPYKFDSKVILQEM